MMMLYDSDNFVVVHIDVNADVFPTPRNCFEIVDKRSNCEVLLHDKWATIFQAQIDAWQQKTPTQEEVEDVLDRYATLAHMPLVMH